VELGELLLWTLLVFYIIHFNFMRRQAAGADPATQVANGQQLVKIGAISQQEFGALKAKASPTSSTRGTNDMTDTTMDATSLDTLGPVDYVVVEFPAGASSFTGEMAKELVALVEAGTIRVIDALVLVKDEDGSVDAMELSDVEDLGPLREVEAQLAELLAADDVDHLAAAMEPGSTAGVLIWENLWAAPFASAARRSGGQLIADGRIPIQEIIASIEADEAAATEGD
jgi:hypothetical protein